MDNVWRRWRGALSVWPDSVVGEQRMTETQRGEQSWEGGIAKDGLGEREMGRTRHFLVAPPECSEGRQALERQETRTFNLKRNVYISNFPF